MRATGTSFGRRSTTLILALFVVMPGERCMAEAETSPTALDVTHAWFSPSMVVDNDPVCESLLEDSKRNFRSTENWDDEPQAFTDHLSRLEEVFVGIPGHADNDSAVQLVSKYWGQQLTIASPGNPELWVYMETLGGCGGGCESEMVIVAEHAIATEDAGHVGKGRPDLAATPQAREWTLYRGAGDSHYVAAIVDGDLQLYKLATPRDWKLSCRILLAPDHLSKSKDPAVRSAVQSIGRLEIAIQGLTRGAGNCGSMDTAYSLHADLEKALTQSLYRPWVAQSPAAPDGAPTEDDDDAFYSTLILRLEAWALGGLIEKRAFDRYTRQFAEILDDLSSFYVSAFSWKPRTAHAVAFAALTNAVRHGFQFNDGSKALADGPEHALRTAILQRRSMSEIRAIPLDKKTASALLDIAVAYPPALSYLLDRGAEPDLGNEFGKTALMYAAQYNELESVRILLAHGADPNAVTIWPEDNCSYTLTTSHTTALHYAARYASANLIEVLIANGASPLFKSVSSTGGFAGYPLDWLRHYAKASATDKGNRHLRPRDLPVLDAMLRIPDAPKRRALSRTWTKEAVAKAAEGDPRSAYRLLAAAIEADADNEAARLALPRIAFDDARDGPALEGATYVIAHGTSPIAIADAWFLKGSVCKRLDGYFYNGELYCGIDGVDPFLRAMSLAPTGLYRKAVLSAVQSGNFERCTIDLPDTTSRATLYFSYVSGKTQRIYVLHEPKDAVQSGDLYWITRFKDGREKKTVPVATARYDLGLLTLTVLDASEPAQRGITFKGAACKPVH